MNFFEGGVWNLYVKILTFEGGKVADDSHDPLTGCPFQLFTEEIARLCDLVEDGESHISTQEPCRCRCLFLDKRRGDPKE